MLCRCNNAPPSSSSLPVSREVVAGADVVGHVDGRGHEVVRVRGVLVVVVQPPGEAEALALDVSTPDKGDSYLVCTADNIKFCMLQIIGNWTGNLVLNRHKVGEY